MREALGAARIEPPPATDRRACAVGAAAEAALSTGPEGPPRSGDPSRGPPAPRGEPAAETTYRAWPLAGGRGGLRDVGVMILGNPWDPYLDLIQAEASAILDAIRAQGLDPTSADAIRNVDLSKLAADPQFQKVQQEAASRGFATSALGSFFHGSILIGGIDMSLALWEGEFVGEVGGTLSTFTIGLSAGASFGFVGGTFNKTPEWLLVEDGGTNVRIYVIGLAVGGGVYAIMVTRELNDEFIGWLVGPVVGLDASFLSVAISGTLKKS